MSARERVSVKPRGRVSVIDRVSVRVRDRVRDGYLALSLLAAF
jgi:hypothetical protein